MGNCGTHSITFFLLSFSLLSVSVLLVSHFPFPLLSGTRLHGDLMTSEPHAGRLQCLTSGQQIPAEDAAAAVRVDIAVGAVLVPESAAVEHGAVALVVAAGPLVVVAVERREHHSVVVAESVATRVTRVPGHLRAAKYHRYLVQRRARV